MQSEGVCGYRTREVESCSNTRRQRTSSSNLINKQRITLCESVCRNYDLICVNIKRSSSQSVGSTSTRCIEVDLGCQSVVGIKFNCGITNTNFLNVVSISKRERRNSSSRINCEEEWICVLKQCCSYCTTKDSILSEVNITTNFKISRSECEGYRRTNVRCCDCNCVSVSDIIGQYRRTSKLLVISQFQIQSCFDGSDCCGEWRTYTCCTTNFRVVIKCNNITNCEVTTTCINTKGTNGSRTTNCNFTSNTSTNTRGGIKSNARVDTSGRILSTTSQVRQCQCNTTYKTCCTISNFWEGKCISTNTDCRRCGNDTNCTTIRNCTLDFKTIIEVINGVVIKNQVLRYNVSNENVTEGWFNNRVTSLQINCRNLVDQLSSSIINVRSEEVNCLRWNQIRVDLTNVIQLDDCARNCVGRYVLIDETTQSVVEESSNCQLSRNSLIQWTTDFIITEILVCGEFFNRNTTRE